jgi:tellurite resistance protein TehA-like permease
LEIFRRIKNLQFKMAVTDIIILVFALILLALSGGFLAKAAYDLGQNPKIGTDSKLSRSRSYLIAAAVISLVGLFLVIVVLALSFIYGDKARVGSQKYIMIGLVAFTFLMILIAGILAAIGSSGMRSAPAYTGQGSDKSAYGFSVAATVILFLGLGLLFLAYLLVLFLRKPTLVQLAQDRVKQAQQAALGIASRLPGGQAVLRSPVGQFFAPGQAVPTPVPAPVPQPAPIPQPNQSQQVLSQLLSGLANK